MKYEILVPTIVDEVFELDKQNGNSYWRDEIPKEMKNVTMTFKLLNSNWIFKSKGIHLVFDIKLELTRKARSVAGVLS